MKASDNKFLDFSYFGKDFGASVVVFLVALPLCMGIAIASGVPPAAGIISAIIGGIVVGLIGGAPLLVSGPAAGLTVIVWQIVQQHGLRMLGIIVLLAGLLQFLAGLFKLGQWFRAISPSVIHGMLAGIGVLIFASQFHIMMDDVPRGSGIQNLLSIPESIDKGLFPPEGRSHHKAGLVGILTIVMLLAWNRFQPLSLKILPAPLVAVVFGSVVAYIFRFPIQFVEVPGSLLDSLRWVQPVQVNSFFDPILLPALLLEVFALAFIASAETLLSTSATDLMHKGPRANYDKELAAQGVGNMMCGMVGALPMTGVIVRSSANVLAGAKTKISPILHGGWLLITVLLFPGLLSLVPISVLAAILVYTGYKLVSPQHIRQLANFGRSEVLIYFSTLLGIVALDLLKGVIIGVVLAVLKLLYTFTHLRIRSEWSQDGRRIDYHMEGAATFIALPKLAAALESVPAGTELHLHFEKLTYIDHACLDLIHNWRVQHQEAGNVVVVEWEELRQRYEKPIESGLEKKVMQEVAGVGSPKG
jgi:MFS superfamily sulfate permease-like transporter